MDDKYQIIFENLNEAVFIHDLEGNFLDVNKEACSRLGYTKEQLLEIGPQKIDSPKYAKMVPQRIQELKSKGKLVFRSAHVTSNGREIPVEINSQVIDFHGKKAILSLAHDITNRIKNEQKILELNKAYESLVSESKSFIWEVDENGLYTYVSPSIEQVLGYKPEEVIGKKHFYDLSPDKEEIKKIGLAFIKEGKKTINLENRLLDKNGKIFWILSYGLPVKKQDGSTGYRGIDRDINENKLNKIKLEQFQKEFSNLVNNIPGIIYKCKFDKNWTMMFVSNYIEQLCGYKASDFVENKIRTYESVIYKQDRSLVSEGISKAVKENRYWEIDYRIISKDEKNIWVHEKGLAIKDNKGNIKHLEGFIFDISKEMEAQEKLKKQTQFTEKMNNLMVGRELKMIELKKEIERLKGK